MTLPPTIKEIGAMAFWGCEFLPKEFVLPDSIIRLGSPKEEERAWFGEGGAIDEMPISPSRFDFPEKLKAYHGGWTSSSYGGYHWKFAQHCYTSDTIVVGSNCDTLGVQLTAKVAYFKSVLPPIYLPNSGANIEYTHFPYKIDKLYVPKGCLDVYKKEYGGHSEIKEIEEIKTIENISLRYASPHQMLKGETCELFDEIQPSDAFDKRIKWSSSNEEVATVDANGIVTAHQNGTAIITVSSYDGSVTNSCEIIVAQPVHCQRVGLK